MSTEDEGVVRRFYEEMLNDRKFEIAPELLTADHKTHDPQAPTSDGPDGIVAIVQPYVEGFQIRWQIEDLFSADDKVVVRWTTTGTHVAELNGIPPTGKSANVDGIAIHRMASGKIAETWGVHDDLGLLQQLGVVPTS